jgi:DNA-binding response OmpR family regulator
MGNTQRVSEVRVLSVEDQRVTTHDVSSFFGRHGWLVDVARDGNQALCMFQECSYSIVMIDVGLPEPGPDGLEVCRRLRAESPTVALIMVTGRDERGDQLRAFAAGADDCLAKPFDPDLLTARAKAVVRRSSAPPSEERRTAREGPRTEEHRFLNRDTGMAHGPRGDVQLTRVELGVFVYCESSVPTALTSEAIAAAAFGRQDHAAKNLVHRHIANIRAKR